MIYVVIHGEYENKFNSLVTENFERAINHYLNYNDDFGFLDIPDTIEFWENEKLIFTYGALMINLINVKNRKDISFWELKNDILKAMERGI